MKLKCPSCSIESLPFIRMFIADICGWAVRCRSCRKRVSHPVISRYILRGITMVGGAFSYGFALYPDQRFNVTRFHIGLGITSLLVIIVFFLCSLTVREDITRELLIADVRKKYGLMTKLFILCVVIGILFFTKDISDVGGIIFASGMVLFYLAVITAFTINWTL